MEKELILEIGTEEIPARFLRETTENLLNLTKRELDDQLLPFKTIKTYGTPRRITLRVEGLSDKQNDRLVEIVGPPKKIAYDEKGKPTKVASGFAKAHGVDVKDLVFLRRDNGELIAIRKKISGKRTDIVLKLILPKITLLIPFRKSMRWGEGNISFVRPIVWILAIYGGKTIHFNLDSIRSGSKTQGHRFLSSNYFSVTDWADYSTKLEKSFVILDQESRKAIIKKNVETLATDLGGFTIEDEELVETTSNLVEYPIVLNGDFDSNFLELPREVLISVMKNNQHYFPVFSHIHNELKLLPHFIFVCGTPVGDTSIVIKGNERVIKARFKDASFFYHEDLKQPLSNRIEKLKTMVFLSNLGTYYEKILRLEKLVGIIGLGLGLKEEIHDLQQAARLSKSDLTTEMVFEFPELQGIMGKYYAISSGGKKEIAQAIEEQYMPTSREGKLPQTLYGSILSIADKMDNISGCFISGLTPTGTSDPYALRRQAIGIINILIKNNVKLSLNELFTQSILSFKKHNDENQFPNKGVPNVSIEDSEKLLIKIIDFMLERYKNYMISEGYDSDVIDAVTSATFDDLCDSKYKIEALAESRKATDFHTVAIAFKRIVNIIKGQSTIGDLRKDLLIEDAEIELYNHFCNVSKNVIESITKNDYKEAISGMKLLKQPVDKFFEQVLVMDKDLRVKQNRLSMLNCIKGLFFKIADFSKLNT